MNPWPLPDSLSPAGSRAWLPHLWAPPLSAPAMGLVFSLFWGSPLLSLQALPSLPILSPEFCFHLQGLYFLTLARLPLLPSWVCFVRFSCSLYPLVSILQPECLLLPGPILSPSWAHHPQTGKGHGSVVSHALQDCRRLQVRFLATSTRRAGKDLPRGHCHSVSRPEQLAHWSDLGPGSCLCLLDE